MTLADFTLDCTGDVVAGDTILWEEAIWPAYKPRGQFRRRATPEPLGHRKVIAVVVRDSYGADKQQHTFSLRVVRSYGYQALKVGDEIRRKGRNIYRNGTKRLPWDNEGDRATAAYEKHGRGDEAREARANRRLIM
jgi:hypothetical protein